MEKGVCICVIIFIIIQQISAQAEGGGGSDDCHADVVFALDGSGSVGSDNWQVTLDFVKAFAERIVYGPDASRVGVVSFGNEATLNIQLNQYEEYPDFVTAVDKITYKDENTNTAAGIRVMRTQIFGTEFDRPDVHNIGIIVTDGVPTYEVEDTQPEADRARDDDIQVFVIGVGDLIDETLLRKLGGELEGHIFFIQDFETLLDNLGRIISSACKPEASVDEPSLTPDIIEPETTTAPPEVPSSPTDQPPEQPEQSNQPPEQPDQTNQPPEQPQQTDQPSEQPEQTNQPPEQPQQTDQPSEQPEETGQPPEQPEQTDQPPEQPEAGTTIAPGEETTTKPWMPVMPVMPEGEEEPFRLLCDHLDLVFVMDSSGSVNQHNWERMKYFVNGIIDRMNVAPEMTMVGVITYSSEAVVNIKMGDYTDKQNLMLQVNDLPMQNQLTNTSGALRLLQKKFFSGGQCDRPNAPNLAIVITDGYSNRDVELTPIVAKTLRDMGSCLAAIGVGMDFRMSELRAIACQPSMMFVHMAANFWDLIQTANIDHVYDSLCNADMKEPKIDVRGIASDIVFVIGHMENTRHFDAMIEYLEIESYLYGNQMEMLNMAVVASTPNGPLLGLEMVGHRYDLTDALWDEMKEKMYFMGNISDVAETVSFAMQSVFHQNGDREDVPNVLVIMTGPLPQEAAARLRYQVNMAQQEGTMVFLLVAAPNKGLDGSCGGAEIVPMMDGWYMDNIASEPVELHQMFFKNVQDMMESSHILYPLVTSMLAEPLWMCDFSSDCGYRQSSLDQFDWTLHQGPTESKHTGPDQAYHSDFYMYIEASSPRNPGDTAVLELPRMAEASGMYCFSLFYHMKGFHTGALKVYTQDGDGLRQLRWQLYGPQGNDWKVGVMTLYINYNIKVIIEGVRAGAFSGDIAIDNLSLRTGPCVRELP